MPTSSRTCSSLMAPGILVTMMTLDGGSDALAAVVRPVKPPSPPMPMPSAPGMPDGETYKERESEEERQKER